MYRLDETEEFETTVGPSSLPAIVRITDYDPYEGPSFDSPGQPWSASWVLLDPDTGEESEDLELEATSDDRMRIDEECDEHLFKQHGFYD